ncbi:hypothetical protein HA402_000547 [Bradysia odoriphaga]|nr:hypothetical protein HA402_000547 [Bradysia odoriphaga]
MKFLALFVALLGLCECFGNGNLPPPEIKCNFLIGCDTFPQNNICAIAVNGCYGPSTFGNDCELDVYNCEHPSNQFYKYWDGSCNPQDDMITISPIEREPFVTIPPEELITISPIEREPFYTISPIEMPITRRPKPIFYTIGPVRDTVAA